MRVLTALAFLATLSSGNTPAWSESAARAPFVLAHTGYTIEVPRGCKLVFSTVLINGVSVVLRQVKCPNGAPPATS